jgi:hypothetical protein
VKEMNKIKCPKCGNATQIKEIESKWVHGMYWCGKKHLCQCSCGHQFAYRKVFYEMTNRTAIEYLTTYEDPVYTGEYYM